MAEGRRRILRDVGVALVVLLGVAAVAGVAVKTRADSAEAVQEAREYTPPPLSTPPPPALPLVVVIGDDTTSRAADGVAAAQRWPALLGQRADVQVRTFASTGAGYLADGSDGRTFLEQARRIPRDADVVVIFGGLADVAAAQSQFSRAVAQTISEAQSRAPEAQVAVVGPVSTGTDSPQAVTDMRLILQNQVGQFGKQFIDPIQRAWLNGVYASGTDLDRPEESAIADQMVVITRQLLPQQD